MKRVCVAVYLILALSLFTGCKTRLEEHGAYNPATTNSAGVVTFHPDPAFYSVDGLFLTLYDGVVAVSDMERDNRELIWAQTHEVKQALDSIRPTIIEVRNGYFRARTAYIKNPTPEGLTGLNQYLAKIQQLATAASAAFPPQLRQTLKLQPTQ